MSAKALERADQWGPNVPLSVNVCVRGSMVGGWGKSRWDCCACVEQKALISEILQKAGEEVSKVIQ